MQDAAPRQPVDGSKIPLNTACSACNHNIEWHKKLDHSLYNFVLDKCDYFRCDCKMFVRPGSDPARTTCRNCGHVPCVKCNILHSYWRCCEPTCREWNVGEIKPKAKHRQNAKLRVTINVDMNSSRELGYARALLRNLNVLHAATKPSPGLLDEILDGHKLRDAYKTDAEKSRGDTTTVAKSNIVYLGDRRTTTPTTPVTPAATTTTASRHQTERWVRPTVTFVAEKSHEPSRILDLVDPQVVENPGESPSA